jgi:hypothetical protein
MRKELSSRGDHDSAAILFRDTKNYFGRLDERDGIDLMAKVQVGSSRDRCDRQLLIVAFDAALCAVTLVRQPLTVSP